MRKKLLVSFSGGETSAFMAKWLIDNKIDEYEMIFVFANTGEENEETLEFCNKCDKEFGLNLVWIEAEINANPGVSFRLVDYKSASRNGEPFEKMIKKFGIPNTTRPFCSRNLKAYPIKSYARSIGWKHRDYHTAIGIRVDECDRVSSRRKEDRILYPLIEMRETNKQEINHFWASQGFRLNLKGYQGNCKTCWKKSNRKLATIALENPEKFEFFKRMEKEYENHDPRNCGITPLRFFRENRTVEEVIELKNRKDFKPATDDSLETNYQTSMNNLIWDVSNGCDESCEAF